MSKTKPESYPIFRASTFIIIFICTLINITFAINKSKDPFNKQNISSGDKQNPFTQATQLHKQPTYKKSLVHVKKIYQDSENQKIYIPEEQLYYRVSLSPDNEAASFLIKKDSGKLKLDLAPLMEEYTRVMISFGEGVEEKYVIYKDIRPPEIELNIEAIPDTQQNLEQFGSCVVSLGAKDADSGIDQVYISINGHEFELYQESLTYIPMKVYSIRTYAVDRVGNVSSPMELVFRIDSILAKQRLVKRKARKAIEKKSKAEKKVAFQVIEKLSSMSPQIVFEKSESQISNTKGNLLAPSSPLVISRFNKIPAIKDVFIKFASNPKSVLKPFQGTPLDLAIQERKEKEEEGTLIEEKKSIDIDKINVKKLLAKFADQEPPFVMVEVLKDRFAEGKYVYVSKRSRIKLLADDANRGVDKVWYDFNQGDKIEYKDPFTVPQKSGEQLLNFSAIDKAANKSPVGALTLFLDTQLPETTHSFSQVPFVRGKSIFINGTTQIRLASRDRDSGVQKILFKINGGEAKTFDKGILFSAEGKHRLEYFAVDQVNNHEKAKQIEFYIDRSPPSIFWQYSNTPRKNTGDSKTQNTKLSYPSNSVLFLAASDQKSGVKKISYRLNNKETIPYRGPILFKEKGDFQLTVYAVDAVGNQIQKQTAFSVY
ncbi:MAG: hypothetical protein HOJ48_05340 [Desulfobacula sp.]|jgi:hypothetical protein|nr:hypothetical protein [Deltaproteobacteria bacterium]MBT6338703.1 hypothetical protein [Desulfobacula sp.]